MSIELFSNTDRYTIHSSNNPALTNFVGSGFVIGSGGGIIGPNGGLLTV